MKRSLAVLAVFSLSVLPYVFVYVLWPTSHLWLPDDAFYYFEIARNIAAGQGSTFDGLNRTNGYHPFWQFFLAGVAMVISDRDTFVSATLVIQCALVCYSWLIAFRLVFPNATRASLMAAGAAAAGICWNYYFSKALINGLESALYLAVGITLLAEFSRRSTGPPQGRFRSAAWLGTLAGVLLLSRLDSVFFIAGVALAWCLTPGRLRPGRAKELMVFCGIPALVLGIYALVNSAIFGYWMPVSGYVKRTVYSHDPVPAALPLYVIFLILLAAVLRVCVGRWTPRSRGPQEAAAIVLTLIVALYQGDQMLIRGVVVPEIWYWVPYLLWLFVVLMLILSRLLSMRSLLWRRAVITGLGLIGAWGIFVTWRIRLEPASYDHYVAVREAADWINQNLPHDTRLAGWDVGILGFYADAQVVNLDGLVNSFEYLDYLESGRTVEYLDKSGVEYICQYYKPSFEEFERFGLDAPAFRARADKVMWSREILFAPMSHLLRTGRRAVDIYDLEVRKYEPAF